MVHVVIYLVMILGSSGEGRVKVKGRRNIFSNEDNIIVSITSVKDLNYFYLSTSSVLIYRHILAVIQ